MYVPNPAPDVPAPPISPISPASRPVDVNASCNLFAPLTLPNGTQLPNRIAKAAMEENMAEAGQLPGAGLVRLYQAWADGGAGLIVTGNVMIDHRALTGPGGVVLEAHTPLEPFRRWAAAARSGGAQVWMQINHPGRQVYAAMGGIAWAPSAVSLELGKYSRLFAAPSPMSEADIADVIARFAATARAAEAAGFTGVEIHAAHGYLLSQFLSPITNRRDDRWGGGIEHRARLLVEVVKAVRATVAPGFAVAVKLNSADFQRGGFDLADARHVIELLNGLPVDLVELSGGSYESPAMQGRTADGHTLAREAYFLEFAAQLAKAARMPLMTTGGIRRREVAEQVLAGGIAVVGIARALAMDPALPRRWQGGVDGVAPEAEVAWKDKALAALATMAVTRRQLQRMGKGRMPHLRASPGWSLLLDRLRLKLLTWRYRRWLAAR